MIRRNHLMSGVALGALLLLGGCGRGGPTDALEQGEWEPTVELTNLQTANLPPEMQPQGMPPTRTQTTRSCWTLTADRVVIENLRFTAPGPYGRGAGCQVAEMVMEGG